MYKRKETKPITKKQRIDKKISKSDGKLCSKCRKKIGANKRLIQTENSSPNT